MLSIYAAMFSLVFFSFCGVSTVKHITYDPVYGTYVIDFWWQVRSYARL